MGHHIVVGLDLTVGLACNVSGDGIGETADPVFRRRPDDGDAVDDAAGKRPQVLRQAGRAGGHLPLPVEVRERVMLDRDHLRSGPLGEGIVIDGDELSHQGMTCKYLPGRFGSGTYQLPSGAFCAPSTGGFSAAAAAGGFST